MDNGLYDISPIEICSLLRKNIYLEEKTNFYSIYDYFDNLEKLKVSPENSIAFEFKNYIQEKKYYLLLILSLPEEYEFSLDLINDLTQLKERSFDKIIIYTSKHIPLHKLNILKKLSIDFIRINNSNIDNISEIKNYHKLNYDKGHEHEENLNALCQILIKRLKQKFHQVFSDMIAEDYNKHYAQTKEGTKSFIDYEEKTIKGIISKFRNMAPHLTENSIAVDLGCGTGKYALILSENFDTVYAVDFSKKMIDQINNKCKKNNIKKIFTSNTDIQNEICPHEEKFIGKVDLIVASFGMGSFIEDTNLFIRRLNEWLKPGGTLYISFYNRDSIVNKMKFNSRDNPLSTELDAENCTLKITLNKEFQYKIFCKPFDNSTRSEIVRVLDEVKISSYPTLQAIIENDYIKEIPDRICQIADERIAEEKEFLLGYYIQVIAQKKEQQPKKKHDLVVKYLKNHNIKFEELKHSMVLSSDNTIDTLFNFGHLDNISIDKAPVIKTLVLKNTINNTNYVCVFPYYRELNLEAFSKYLDLDQRQVSLLSDKELSEFGFDAGSIPPFGYNEEERKYIYFKHPDINKLDFEWVYVASGDNNRTIKIPYNEFIIAVNDFNEIS